jgi:hypothetical protein
MMDLPLSPGQEWALKEEHNRNVPILRHNAYVLEADPLFFKAQRGEATQQEWLDKVAEIKTRYAYKD